MPADIRQSSFGRGEIAPTLYGRMDIQQYDSALRRCRNFIVTPHGALMNRPGTRFIAAAKDSTQPVRLVPFIFSNDQAFVLEFGAGYIRFYRNGAPVLSGGAPVEVTTTYAAADLFRLKFAQSGDVITIAHRNYPPMDLSRLVADGTSWSFGATAFAPSWDACEAPLGARLDPSSLVADSSGKTWAWGVTAVYADGSESELTATSEVTTPIDISKGVIIGWGGTLAARSPVGYNIYRGRAGVFGWIAYVSISQSLRSFTDSGLTADFSLAPPTHEVPFHAAPAAWAPDTEYHTGDRVTANGNTYEALNFGRSASTGGGPAITQGCVRDGANAWVPNHAYALGEVVCVNGMIYTCTQAGTSANPSPAYPGAWLAVPPVEVTDNTCKWLLSYKLGRAVVWKFIQTGAAAPVWPAVVAYHEQRRVFANTVKDPARVVASRTGDFHSFDVEPTPLSTDALDFSLATSRYEEIRSFLQLRVLLALTSEKDWSISGGNGPIGPTSILAQPNNVRGASWLDPLTVGVSGLYVQALGSRIWELVFDFYTQSYLGNNVTVFADHLFQNHVITDWTYAQVPHSVVWAVREDGVLLGFTYLREQEVSAWHWHDTAGTFESVCAVPEVINPGGAMEHAVYVVVRRLVNGSYVRYIERFSTRLGINRLSDGTLDTRVGVFLDASLSYAGAPVTTFSGLSHLEGCSVMVLADGNVLGPYTVTGGSISIAADYPDGASLATVGLAYVSEMETLDLKVQGENVRSNVKAVTRLSFEVVDSRGFWFGPSFDKLKEWKQRTVADSYNPVAPFTGLQHIRIPTVYEHNARACVRQVDPLPVTLVGLGREVDVGGD